ncbi:MAG TPA: aminotransferase class V-fold PLP-dependent enzyme [Actinomycetota bacterium]|nr:aminotransferase class V-fold PLP-dependent enzyme [Actinomycetota bacterium]
MTPNLLSYRDEFPVLADKVFLGSHTLAPLSRRARAAVDRFMDTWQSKASAELVWFEDVIPEMRRVEACFARLINADPGEVALTPSVSAALSSLASCFDFSARDEVVISRQEFPTDCHAWLAQQRRGARVVWADGKDERAYAAALGPRTAVVSASRVSYLDGSLLDPDALAASCRDAGAFCVLDDYHGSGVVPLDVHAVGAEALVSGPLKYLLGGPGVAFLYVRADVAPSLHPTVTGWFSQRDFFAFDSSRLDWPDTSQRFALGTPSPAAVYAAGAGLDMILEVGVDAIRSRTLELSGLLIDALQSHGYRVRTPREPQRRGAVVSWEVDDSKRVLHDLLSRGVILDERHGCLRACPHFFNTEGDLDALLTALGQAGGLRP